MNILGILPSERVGACEAYRVTYPLRKLEMMGHKTAVLSAGIVRDILESGQDPWAGVDVILFQRITVRNEADRKFFEVPLLLRSLGKTVIMDYDDDYTNTYRHVHDGTLEGLDHFSAITVSTPYLKHMMKPYNRNVTVLPNLVVPEMFQGFQRLVEGTVIGLTGSNTHKEDWQAVYAPLHRVCERFPDVKLFVSGYVPEELRDIPNLLTVKDLLPDINIEGDNFFIPLAQYGGILRQIDILLAPVDPLDKFNWSKSNLKAIEGQMSKCAVIATGDVPCYQDAIKSEKTGLLVNHADEVGWETAMTRLISDVKFRHKISEAGFDSCNRDFSIHSSRIRDRVVAYQDIQRRDAQQHSHITASAVAALAQ